MPILQILSVACAIWLLIGGAMLVTSDITIDPDTPKLFILKSLAMFTLVGPWLLIQHCAGRK